MAVRSRPPLLAALAALAVAALVAGCATAPVAEVTRFNIGQPIPAGTITVEAKQQAQAASLEFRTHAAAVAEALAGVGFATAGDDKSSTYIAVLEVTQAARQGPPRPAPLPIGIGGGGFTGGVGLGGGVSVPVGKAPDSTIRTTTLDLRIRRRADGSTLWEGRAVQDLPAGANPAAAVAKLAKALLAGFPGKSGETIAVKTGA